MLQGNGSVRIFEADNQQHSHTTYHPHFPQPPMDHAPHTLEIELLRRDRNEFILQCQHIIALVVNYHIHRGMFPASDHHDIVQSVNVELIRRLDSIERNFNGSVLLNTYMNVVIRNICLRIYERTRRSPVTEPITEYGAALEPEALNPMLLQDEYRRFSILLRLFGTKQAKIVFCFKIYFRMPVTEHDVRRAFDRITDEQRGHLLERFGSGYDDSMEIDNFNIVAPLMNIQEMNATSGRSLRRWTLEQLTRTIALLNGDPPVRSHTKETIKLLLEEVSP